MSLSSELNEVIKKLQVCRSSLALMTEHVQFESDAYAQILQWSSDLEFVEMLIGMWMDEHKIHREERLSTKHQKGGASHRDSKVMREALLNDEWIGAKNGETSRG